MNVFLLEYRGFGISEGGDPSEHSLVEDARAALVFLHGKLSRISHTSASSAAGAGESVSVTLTPSGPSARSAASDPIASANPWGSRVIVLGSSIGGAVAVQLLSDAAMAARVYCMILENTFTSVPDMARAIIASTLPPIAPCVKHLPDRLLRNQVLVLVAFSILQFSCFCFCSLPFFASSTTPSCNSAFCSVQCTQEYSTVYLCC